MNNIMILLMLLEKVGVLFMLVLSLVGIEVKNRLLSKSLSSTLQLVWIEQ